MNNPTPPIDSLDHKGYGRASKTENKVTRTVEEVFETGITVSLLGLYIAARTSVLTPDVPISPLEMAVAGGVAVFAGDYIGNGVFKAAHILKDKLAGTAPRILESQGEYLRSLFNPWNLLFEAVEGVAVGLTAYFVTKGLLSHGTFIRPENIAFFGSSGETMMVQNQATLYLDTAKNVIQNHAYVPLALMKATAIPSALLAPMNAFGWKALGKLFGGVGNAADKLY
jgi:hypothetical protein